MSPRRTRPKRRPGPAPSDEDSPLRLPDLPVPAPPGWQVRTVQAVNALKQYRCPGCNQEIRPHTTHIVAWRTGDDPHRRHWHTPCWRHQMEMPS